MADAAHRPWYRYGELRPDQLARVKEARLKDFDKVTPDLYLRDVIS